MMGTPWNDQEVRRLRELWHARIPVREIAREFGRSEQAVYQKAYSIGLGGKGHPRKVILSADEKLWLRLNYPYMRTSLCAMRFNISEGGIEKIAHRMGIRKSPEFIRELRAYSLARATAARQNKHTQNR